MKQIRCDTVIKKIEDEYCLFYWLKKPLARKGLVFMSFWSINNLSSHHSDRIIVNLVSVSQVVKVCDCQRLSVTDCSASQP